MMLSVSSLSRGLALAGTVAMAQQPGTLQPEVHPELWMQECSANGCSWEKGSVVMDANWRWVEKGGTNCYTDENTWDPALCPDGQTCAQNCAIEGADYEATYGVTTNTYKDGVDLKFVTEGKYSSNFGSRLYLMDSDSTYKMFKLKNREFSFDVDVSTLTCGLNGALYFVEMDEHGDYDGVNNKAGAKYGTGYCDAQCPHDIKWMKGEANLLDWQSTSDPPVGHYGACCAEMDIWEANRRATAYTPHPCSEAGLTKCEGTTCGDNAGDHRYEGICDKDGCDFNNYRMGETSFYGKGGQFDVDTTKPMSVVTQFITADGTDTGDLVDIRRFYVQDGRVIENSQASILGAEGGNSITDGFCSKQKAAFGDIDDFANKGGLKKMGEALDRGMVLVLSLWDDSQVNMLWLDATYPTDVPSSTPGVQRGPCPGGRTSEPSYLRETTPSSHVTFSQIKLGTLGSTFSGGRRMSSDFV
jgi:cellulose 1,4-beta-cellobiosidase